MARGKEAPRRKGPELGESLERIGEQPLARVMHYDSAMANAEINELRQRHYNASVTRFERVHDDLAIIRVQADDGPLAFDAGQYTVLGLGGWEARVKGTQAESAADAQPDRLIRRAYSISARLLDDNDTVIRADGSPDIEFYVALVRKAKKHPPALTPRLFLLSEGSRVHMGRRAHGRYTTARIRPSDNVIFCATGTGEAPHNAMIAELLARGHQGRIVSIVSVRYRYDLAYVRKHRLLERSYKNYRYLPLTTREPENLDASCEGFVGKRYIQDFCESGDLQAAAGIDTAPESTHFFLCGNPAMVGLPPQRDSADPVARQATGMMALLERRGFQLDLPHAPGNLHVELFW